MLFHIVAGSPLELTRRICWFILALAFFSRSSATILKASDFTFGLLCFGVKAPPPGHLTVAIVLWLRMCNFVAIVSLRMLFFYIHKVVIIDGRSLEPC